MTSAEAPLGAIGEAVRLGCLLEVTARKPGNVHPQASFSDTTFIDFVQSAAAIAPILDTASTRALGDTIFEATVATCNRVGKNTNLGIILLLAPLATADGLLHGETAGTQNGAGLEDDAGGNSRPVDLQTLRGHLRTTLARTSREDAEQVYAAIRAAAPGGLGEAPEGDVRQAPTGTLREMMEHAAERDGVARQYANDFEEVFEAGVPTFRRAVASGYSLEDAILTTALTFIARGEDTLIRRKCGDALHREASQRAKVVLRSDWPHAETGRQALADFDQWLRSDGHRRNPGTSADLTAAVLFLSLRNGIIP